METREEARAEMRLDLPFDAIPDGSAARERFESAFREDVSRAIGASVKRVRVVGLRAGSVRVGFVLLPSPSDDDASVREIVETLRAQLADKASPLRRGAVTSAPDGGALSHAQVMSESSLARK